MAGGKQTPRQKMIGMMYLILTALLALNVSKEVVAAFITINDKLESSADVINKTSEDTYGTFDSKRAAIQAENGDTKDIDLWQGKAEELKKRTKQMIHYLLGESNEMISTVEDKEDWIQERDDDGLIVSLKPLVDIQKRESYDHPTRMFVGGDPSRPVERGLAILDSIRKYRNDIAELMGTYKVGDKSYSFTAPETVDGLEDALKTANPDDTTAIAQFYRSLFIPDQIEILDAGQPKMVPWPSAMFDKTPVVAAAAIFTSIKLDILNSENHAANYMLGKVDAPIFNFNKIEPLAFARTGYINEGDSLDIRIMIAAYDSTDVPPIQYGINDSVRENWKTTTGAIKVKGSSPGNYNLTGLIGVREKGELSWKPWSFSYSVGKPSGAISLPEMNVLYRGYANRVEGAASGFPSYTLSGGGNVTVTKSGNGYTANPGNGRTATIIISGVAEDGTTTQIGRTEFRVQNLPKPSISLGRIADGETATPAQIRASRQLFAGYPPEIPLDAKFTVQSYEVRVSGAPRPASGNGAVLNGDALRIISNAQSGSTISIFTTYKEPSGRTNRQSAAFKVN